MPASLEPSYGLVRTLQDALSACRLLFVVPGDDDPVPCTKTRKPRRLVWDLRGQREKQRQVSVLGESWLDV